MTVGYFKLWDGILDNIKVQRLTPELFMAWINIIAVTVRYGGCRGELPSWEDMVFGLRADRGKVERWVKALVTAGLIDHKNGRNSIHDFEKWNESKDKTAAKRQKAWRHRNAERNALRNGVTGPSHNTPQVLEEIEGEKDKKNTPLPPTGDEVVDFGRTTMKDRFDLEDIGGKLPGWRAAKYPDGWICDAILVANCNATVNQTASYINTCLRRWKTRGGPDPDEVGKARSETTPAYVPPVTDPSSLYGPKWKPSTNGTHP